MRVTTLAAMVGCLTLLPMSALAAPCAGFDDVDTGASYCTALVYLKNRGVTAGCTATSYCPGQFVTRAQMALFMQRLARGGPNNVLANDTDTIGGGDNNSTAGGDYAIIGGGSDNHASAAYATIAGGQYNTASAPASTVAGGGFSTASGDYSFVAGGFSNSATTFYAFAAGSRAVADQVHCALFALWSTSIAMNCIGAPNIFRVGGEHGFAVDYHSQRDDGGGTRWVSIGDVFANQTITAWNGAYLTDGGIWTNNSDRNAKTDFVDVDPAAVLEKLATMPVSQWRYKIERDQTHLGPMAQDFYAAFGLGNDDRHISTLDASGVALAAIQGLNAKVSATLEAREVRIAELEVGNAELRRRNELLERRLETVERAIGR